MTGDRRYRRYASATVSRSVAPSISMLRVLDAGKFTISIYRVGHYGRAGSRHMLDSPPLTGTPQPALRYDESTGRVGCDWTSLMATGHTGELDERPIYRRLHNRLEVSEPHALRRTRRCDHGFPGRRLAVPDVPSGQPLALDTVHGKSLGHGYVLGRAPMRRTRRVPGGHVRPALYPYRPTGAGLCRHRCDRLVGAHGYDVTYVSDVDIQVEASIRVGSLGSFSSAKMSTGRGQLRDRITKAVHRGTSLAFLGAGTAIGMPGSNPRRTAGRTVSSLATRPS